MTEAPTTARARLSEVSLTYDEGRSWALEGLDLTIREGERLCVLGPNGSGKSTLAQLVCGLEAPDAGTVELAGQLAFDGTTPDARAYRAARHRTGLVFQNPEDQLVTSVAADDVAFGPENLGVPSEEIARRVDEELERVALADRALSDPLRLSGGQQQRLAIAGALAMHPDMLVLDEPGAMLDVRGRRGVMRLLGDLQNQGVTLLHVTHFMDEALAADRVVVLRAGRVALEGTPREVFSHAEELREAGLDVPLVTRVSLDLGLGPCCSAEELASALREGCATGARRRDAAGRSPVSVGETDRVPVAACDDATADAAGGATGRATVSACDDANAPATARTAAPALRLRDVSFRYGQRSVLDHVSLEVAPGELVALIGQTGSGKSTLARLSCALARPTSGSVEVEGLDTSDRRSRRALRGRVGYVMQHPERQLFAETVFDDVAYGPRNLGLSAEEVRRRVEGQLAFLGLADKAQASPFGLSGGQQRLVALAGVLAMNPSLLVLDEPVAGLDPRGAERLREVIRSLHARGVAMLMISHSMEDVAQLADRAVVLNAGSVIMGGSPREVFSHAEKLHEISLGVPAPLALARELASLGVPVATEPLTAEELVESLAGARGSARGKGRVEPPSRDRLAATEVARPC